MAEAARTFSENWHRVADQRVALRAQVSVQRQFFRGEKWFVLGDPFNNQFFRLRPAAYRFVSRLRPERTVEEVWRECLEDDPDDAPGQEDVVQLLAQLYYANLLRYSLPPDTTQLFERYKKRKQRETRSRLLSVMFARFPLLDPDAFLRWTLPLVKRLFSVVGLVLWLAVVLLGLKVVVENFPALREQTQSVLAPGNLPLLYLGLILIKVLHEFGHAYACRAYGGEVHTMGVMLLVFTPLPYMDATASWAFRSRSQRALVAGAGMIVEIFVAAIAALVWANTGPGTLHSLAYNMMFIASVSTVLFNINPLLRFDGYYILSDLLDIPNLHQRAGQQLSHLAERYLFGRTQSKSPTASLREASWLTGFGIASHIYRVVIFAGIILFVADRFLIVGALFAVVCVVSWIFVPLGKFVHYLATSPRLARCRPRAISASVSIVGSLVLLLGVIPFPTRVVSPGVLESVDHTIVANEVPGQLVAVQVSSGTRVTHGQPLLQFENEELEFQLAQINAQLTETRAHHRRALQLATADLAPIQRQVHAIEERQRELLRRREALTVRAPQDGLWIAPVVEHHLGQWFLRGAPLGQVIDDRAFQFSAVVSQQEAARLFDQQVRTAEVRLRGQAGSSLPVTDQQIIPAEQQQLPSAALGFAGGGEVAIDLTDPQGVRAQETFFQVRANVAPAPDVSLLHGRSGRIRFTLPAEPLLQQWIRKLRQLLQSRFQF